ncbi:aldehyde dehydrogenase family protein [Paenarthrobacter sp. PH39-S1]|uniref:aldehyde dehydrogenase family protein n=1 Tax=Paenarthrobacter sp. PH39-S1 TaxID=3046204 RepID=UPI0024B87E35|nr:aldehyde dehydrogenase family protein [Paenarthrobacter sp. PH39-S1]MDJ0355422.1 aldehyde dehydrogenase family protein [Paenarthrobacter sp. PH39-S1]
MTEDISGQVAAARAVFNSGATRSLAWRTERLRAVRRMLTERGQEFADALRQDLGKHPSEAWLTEIGFVTAEISHTLRNLTRWLAPERSAVPLALQPASAQIIREPLGVVLVIAPWNYPVQLLLAPAVGALAAGNTVVVKPSEVAPVTSAAMQRWIPQYLDSAVFVVEGGAAETTALLTERFDHIFYTGNGVVGRLVMLAAAEHLTPVTLELGGKSPVYVDDSVDLPATAMRLAWGKYLNAGQTCVAPDYVLGSAAVLVELARLLPLAISALYGADPRRSTEYGRIVNDRHFQRLVGLLDTADVITGGERDADSRYLAPTVVRAGAASPLMQEEIFGPVLPLVETSDADEAIHFINERDKPLSLYVFTERAEIKVRFTEQTSSGALCFGIPAAHLLVPGLPFGGIGASGMGGYHGRFSVDTFSHRKAVLDKPLKPDTMKLVYPPFNALKNLAIRKVVAPNAAVCGPAGAKFRRADPRKPRPERSASR